MYVMKLVLTTVVIAKSKDMINLKKALDDNLQLKKTMGELQTEYEEHV